MEQQRRIWGITSFRRGGLGLAIHAHQRDDIPVNLSTIFQVRDSVRLRVSGGDTVTSIMIRLFYGTRPTVEELDVLGQSCLALSEQLRDLCLSEDGWTDGEVSRMLRHAVGTRPSSVDCLRIKGIGAARLPATIRLIQDGAFPALRALYLWTVRLNGEDCHALGRIVSDRERPLTCLRFCQCLFPSLADFSSLVAGFFKDKIPSDECTFQGSVVENDSPLSRDDPLSDPDRFLVGLWVGNAEAPKEDRLGDTAAGLLDSFRRLQLAGLRNLLPLSRQGASVTNIAASSNGQQLRDPQPTEWIEAFAHEAVNDRLDLLFYLLILNPEICAKHRVYRLLPSENST